MDGKINVDDLITHTLKPDDTSRGFDLMHEGKVDPLGGRLLSALTATSKHSRFGRVSSCYNDAPAVMRSPACLPSIAPRSKACIYGRAIAVRL